MGGPESRGVRHCKSTREAGAKRRPAWGLLLGLVLAACGDGPEVAAVADMPRADPAAIPRPSRLALVLSSGGPRGFAHIGVLKVLEDAGVRPDLIVGSSSGALVGVLYASGMSATALEAKALAIGGSDVFDYDLFRRRISGTALQTFVNETIGGRPLHRLRVPVAVVATRADDGLAVAFTRGDAGAAVRASSAVPGSFAPVQIATVTYIDGDVGAPLPIALARALGAERVIAVDAAQNVARAPPPSGAPASWTAEAVARRIKIAREAPLADVLVEPPLPYITGFSLDYRRMAIATGEAAARAALPQITALHYSNQRPSAASPTMTRSSPSANGAQPGAWDERDAESSASTSLSTSTVVRLRSASLSSATALDSASGSSATIGAPQ